jgi:hypothetical protein
MPYIKTEQRAHFDPLIEDIVDTLLRAIPYSATNEFDYDDGELNYVISSIVWKLFDDKQSYKNGSRIVAALECAKQEFYRRKLSELENKKIKENGDL